MTKSDLRVGQVWRDSAGVEREVIHVAVAGCGDSVAWRGVNGAHAGGGSAWAFVASHDLVRGVS